LGFVGAYLNPDPAGDKQTPGVHEEYWFPLYEKAVQLDVPLMVHPSITYDRRLEAIPANYQMNNYLEEFVAMQLYSHSKVFESFYEGEDIISEAKDNSATNHDSMLSSPVDGKD